MPQTDRHEPDDRAFSVRVTPPELKSRLADYIAATGQSRSSFINEAIREKLDRAEAPVS